MEQVSYAPAGKEVATPRRAFRLDVLISVEVLVLLVFLAYSNSFSVPYLLDDIDSIPDNHTIWHLWPPQQLLLPPHHGETVGARPLLNITLAVNYAISGEAVWSYHLFNILIHAAAAVTLFGVMRRTLLQPRLRALYGEQAFPLALAVAVLWMLHPLQTESVTYIVQRAEAMMGFFYLFTLYAFIRGTDAPNSTRWFALAFVSCLLGMASKEVMVSASLAVFLYDRTFIAGTFREAWRKRWKVYAALASTWLLLAWAVLMAGNRGGTVVANKDMPWNSYVIMQFNAVVEYLRLTFWPSPLIFDYTGYVIHNRLILAIDIFIVLVLLSLAARAIYRNWATGFAWFIFFATLAPTTSVLVVSTQTLCDRRMYLALAPVLAVFVLAVYRWMRTISLPLFAVLALTAGVLTFVRNMDFRDAVTIWTVTLRQLPDSACAQNNLGDSLLEEGRMEEAKGHLEEAYRLKPDNSGALDALGIIAFKEGHPDEGIQFFLRAIAINPDHAATHFNYGYALEHTGHLPEAIAQYKIALNIRPYFDKPREALERLDPASLK